MLVLITRYFYVTIIYYIMYVAITCCIMTCSISKGFVTYRGSMECEINYNYNYNKMLLLECTVH
jgi:hypothetical protein